MVKKGQQKSMLLIIGVLCVKNDLKGLLTHCWSCIMIVLLWIVHFYENDHFLNSYVNMSFALVLRHDYDTCYVNWERINFLKRMYHFEGRVMHCYNRYYYWGTVTRRDKYYILRYMSHTPMNFTIEVVLHALTDAWRNMSSTGPWLRDNNCVSLG